VSIVTERAVLGFHTWEIGVVMLVILVFQAEGRNYQRTTTSPPAPAAPL
jgi:hypothetical protein